MENLSVYVTAAVDRQMDAPIRIGGYRIDQPTIMPNGDHEYFEGQYITVTPAGVATIHQGRPFRALFRSTCASFSREIQPSVQSTVDAADLADL